MSSRRHAAVTAMLGAASLGALAVPAAASVAQSSMPDASRSAPAPSDESRPARSLPVAALGPRDGRLAPCPRTPNCVGSFERGRAAMPAIPYVGDRPATESRLLRVLGALPRVTVVRHEGDYLRAEFTSRIFRFVDDVEFLFDDVARVVHFRSASRVGRGDFGVNRRRMSELSARMRAP